MANKNSVNIAAFPEYIKENITLLLQCAILGARTLQYVTIITGIKHSERLRKGSADVAFSSYSSAWDTDAQIADVVLTPVVLTVGEVEWKFQQSVNSFNQMAEAVMLNGSNNQNIPWQQQIFDLLVQDVVWNKLEVAFWQGDTASVNADLARFDGFIKMIDNNTDAPVQVANHDITTPVGVFNTIIDMILARPAAILDKNNIIYVPYEFFTLLVTYLSQANLYHYKMEEGDFTLMMPGYNVKIVAIKGLNATNRMILTYKENMLLGTDMKNEEEELVAWYEINTDKVRVRGKMKYGTQVVCGGDIVVNWEPASGSGVGRVVNGSNVGL